MEERSTSTLVVDFPFVVTRGNFEYDGLECNSFRAAIRRVFALWRIQ